MYKINYSRVKSLYIIPILSFFSLIPFLMILDLFDSLIFIPFLIPFLLFVIGIVIYVKIKINNLKHLEMTGTLVKNLEYSLERTGRKRRNLVPVVYYKLPDGKTVRLVGEHYSENVYKQNSSIQLLIDKNNPKNYYLDFNIL